MNKWKVISTKKGLGLAEDIINEILLIRNIPEEERQSFFNPSIEDLKIANVSISRKELKKAVSRINKAIKNNEKIIILGDYDVDGICASAILWETIFKKYKNVFPYIPDRFSEGYGISIKSLKNVLEKYPDVKLIITVDNGIVGNEAVDFAKNEGVDVIITDHHVAGEKSPNAHAIVHTTDLCGAGVAWMLARELNFLSDNEINEKLSLASLATVADLVPLIKMNRAIVSLGLKYLQKTKRPGLLAIYKNAKIDNEKIEAYHLGFMIGPRLNATGRVYHAMDSLRLICTKDKNFASTMARKIEETNKTRQQMVLKSFEHAKLSVLDQEKLGKIVGVYHESYSEGIVGLIASKLVEAYHRPSFAISVGEKISKGSARSISGINIIEILRSVPHLLKEAGGHPMAAGFSIETKNIDKFYSALQVESDKFEDELFEKQIKIDLELSFEFINEKLYKDIQTLSPFGMGNPQPVFMTKNVKIIDRRNLGKDGSHLKLKVSSRGMLFDAIGFGLANNFDAQIGDSIDIVYTIDVNEWNNKKTIQLKIRDLLSA